VSQDETDSAKSEDIDNMIDTHYSRLLKHERYKQCIIRVYIEANMSFIDADRVAKRLTILPIFQGRIEVVRFDDHGRYGIWTSKDKKECYAMQLQISIPRARFVNDKEFLSQDEGGHKKEVFKQLKAFRKEVEEPKNGSSSTALFYKCSYTGKSTGEKDDWAMVYGILLHHMWRDVSQNEAFLQKCERAGLPPAVAQVTTAAAVAA
jgi:hypothetical protein